MPAAATSASSPSTTAVSRSSTLLRPGLRRRASPSTVGSSTRSIPETGRWPASASTIASRSSGAGSPRARTPRRSASARTARCSWSPIAARTRSCRSRSTTRLGEARISPSSGPTPYGFAFAGDTLVVTEAFGAQTGKAAASSYRLSATSATPVSRSVGNGRSEICWAVVTNDGRYAFTTNFADGAVSRYAIANDGSIALEDAAAGMAVDGETGLRDEDLSADGRFLYAVDTDSGRVFGWAVQAGGELEPLGSWAGLPATAAGLAAS